MSEVMEKSGHAGYDDHAEISSIRYVHPELSSQGVEFMPKGLWTPLINPNNILYRTLFEPFDVEQYLYPRLPVDMGYWDVEGLMNHEVPNVLRLPIKNPGTQFKIPQELAPLLKLIDRVANYDKRINPHFDKAFCHITFDLSDVEPGQYHRFPGMHGDGFQGSKLTPKILPEHSYILVTDPATEVCLQPFFLKHLDEAKHNEFLECDSQAHPANIYRTLPGHLYLIDPYIVHRTPKITKKVRRLFIRITFTFLELEHPKNTVNPMLEPYEYEDRIDIRDNLAPFNGPTPFYLYGLTKGEE